MDAAAWLRAVQEGFHDLPYCLAPSAGLFYAASAVLPPCPVLLLGPPGEIPMVSALAATGGEHRLTTEEPAEQLGMSPQTLLKRYSQSGSYFNIKPDKLPTGRLR